MQVIRLLRNKILNGELAPNAVDTLTATDIVAVDSDCDTSVATIALIKSELSGTQPRQEAILRNDLKDQLVGDRRLWLQQQANAINAEIEFDAVVTSQRIRLIIDLNTKTISIADRLGA